MKPSTLVSVALGLATTASSYNDYTSLTEYFLQDDDETDDAAFDFTTTNFGLINRTYDADEQSPTDTPLTQWQRFYNQVVLLNDESPSDVNYKVLFLGRHGQGWHNAADQFYGWPAWNCYWSLVNGNGTASWRDSHLTDVGIAQAQRVHDFWQKLIDTQHIHTPDSYLVSPLTRTLQTANVTFGTLTLPPGSAAFQPLIHELFREYINIQTCNMRSSRTYIHSLFPDWPIASGLPETDELWNGITGETDAAQDLRSRGALESIFGASNSKSAGLFVSVTSHSGEIASLLRVLGHRRFTLDTGGVIPVTACDVGRGVRVSVWCDPSDQKEAFFESSEFLAETLARYTILDRHCRTEKLPSSDGFDNAIVQVYKAVLEFTAEVEKQRSTGKLGQKWNSIVAVSETDLTRLQSAVKDQDQKAGNWNQINIQLYQSAKEDEILASIGKPQLNVEIHKISTG
ncbi:phosphoglycerate mutase family protein [Aspergillus affinis]|uniref:phosphoglycerate mutase family protein n=1 Tax=Aspergillus affinis TaxID=1070780 RepID=UPI0022FE6995|nr:uncharacterized protein KD926_006708 [Aspergillus affinis]KAI9041634.1 hypothetical protein KD926_006708 [Aspergillus affinis]